MTDTVDVRELLARADVLMEKKELAEAIVWVDKAAEIDRKGKRRAVELHHFRMMLAVEEEKWEIVRHDAERILALTGSMIIEAYGASDQELASGEYALPSPHFREDAMYYTVAACFHLCYKLNDGSEEYAFRLLERMDSHRAKILRQLLLYLDSARPWEAEDLIVLLDDEAYARTIGEKHYGEQLHYHTAISCIGNHFNSKRKPDKAVSYLQRELNVIRDERLLSAARQQLSCYRKGVFGWKYVEPS